MPCWLDTPGRPDLSERKWKTQQGGGGEGLGREEGRETLIEIKYMRTKKI